MNIRHQIDTWSCPRDGLVPGRMRPDHGRRCKDPKQTSEAGNSKDFNQQVEFFHFQVFRSKMSPELYPNDQS